MEVMGLRLVGAWLAKAAVNACDHAGHMRVGALGQGGVSGLGASHWGEISA